MNVMKNAKMIGRIGFLIAGIAMLFTSCEDDLGLGLPGDSTSTDVSPSLSTSTESGFVVGSTVVSPSETFSIKFTAVEGTYPLNTVTVLEEGVPVDLSRLSYDGASADANPKLLFGADKNSLTMEIDIAAHADAGTKTYSVEIKDEEGATEFLNYEITTQFAEAVPPSLSYAGSSVISAAAGSLIKIPIDAQAGSASLTHIAVAEGDALVQDIGRLYFGDSSTAFTDNPHPLSAEDQSGFVKDLYIRIPEMGRTLDYRVYLIDATEEGSFFDFTVESADPLTLIQGVLFNAAGPAGTGGLDLDDGASTGSDDILAEIKDEGINLDLPNADNWKRQIGGVDGAELRYVIAGQNGVAESFSFESTRNQTEIVAAFDNGIGFVSENLAGLRISNIIHPDDVFAVKDGESYYLIKIQEVNTTSGDNGDHYVIDIMK